MLTTTLLPAGIPPSSGRRSARSNVEDTHSSARLPNGIERTIHAPPPPEGQRPRIVVKYKLSCQGKGCGAVLIDRVDRATTFLAKHAACCSPAWKPLLQGTGETAQVHAARLQQIFQFQLLPGEREAVTAAQPDCQAQPVGQVKRSAGSPARGRPIKKRQPAKSSITEYFFSKGPQLHTSTSTKQQQPSLECLARQGRPASLTSLWPKEALLNKTGRKQPPPQGNLPALLALLR